MDPFISVIIPVFNRTNFVNEAFDSVLNQTLEKEKYEIIVVTNVDVPLKDGVKIVKSENKWQGPFIYDGIKEAQGEIICPLDDDDLFLPNKLEVVYEVFKKNRNLGLFKHPAIFRNYLGKEFMPLMLKNPLYISNSTLNKKIMEEILGLGVGWNSSTHCFNKNVLLEYKDCIRRIKSSVDSIAYLFLSKYDIMIWDSPLSIYRIHKSHDYLFSETNLKQLVKLNKTYYDDYITINNCINDEIARSLISHMIALKKIQIKFYDIDNEEDLKITLKDIFLAQSINKFAFLAYISTFFPSSLRKIAIRYALKRLRRQLNLDS